MIKCLHFEVILTYNHYLRKYNINRDKDLLRKLPKEIFMQIAESEYNHDCEDIHYSLNKDIWFENFIRRIKEYDR